MMANIGPGFDINKHKRQWNIQKERKKHIREREEEMTIDEEER